MKSEKFSKSFPPKLSKTFFSSNPCKNVFYRRLSSQSILSLLRRNFVAGFFEVDRRTILGISSNGQVELFMTKQFQVAVFEILVVEIRRLFSDEFILSHSAFVFGFWLVISLTRWDPSKFCCFFSPFVVFHRLTFR